MTKTGRPAVRVSDTRRFAAHAAATTDPEMMTTAIMTAFTALHLLTRQGERAGAAGAAAVVTNQAVLLCAIAATSAVQADDKARLLTIVARWAISRDPRLTAVLQASVQQEQRRWSIGAEN